MFDFGGVVGNQDVINVQILNSVLEKLAITKKQFWYLCAEKYAECLNGRTSLVSCLSEVSKNRAVELEKYILSEFKKRLEFDNQVINHILELKNKGHRVICVSNVIQEYYEIIKNAKGYGCFDELYFSFELGCSKPNVSFIKKVLSKENLLVEDAIFIDDNIENINSVEKLGVNSILFTDFEKMKKII